MNPETLVIEIENILGNAPKKERQRLIEAVEKGLAAHAASIPPVQTSSALTDAEIGLVRGFLLAAAGEHSRRTAKTAKRK